MSRVATIEPQEGWRVGDRAYCVFGSSRTAPPLIEGKVYEVSSVIPIPGMVGCGLGIAGVSFPEGQIGCRSNRFILLRPGERALDEIRRRTSWSWSEAYEIQVGRRERPA